MTAAAGMGRLLLIPTDLAPGTSDAWAGPALRQAVAPLRRFVVEHPKTARQFLKALGLVVQDLELHVLDEHSRPEDAVGLAKLLESGDLGLLSEAGCPAVADPGASLVEQAQRLGAQVVPLVGPSSLMLALMASGLNGQRFAFHGYLPARSPEREEAIRQLEIRSRREHETELFIEAPYRNDALFSALLATCKEDTRLCVATDLTSATETIATRTVAEWSRQPRPGLDRRPTVFLLLAPSANRAARSGRP
jgi:16S rRNA (cytidine1402-2'-O)-methyltransferase